MINKRGKKGQASFEYILVAAVIGITILPAAYLFYQYSFSTADQIDKAQLDQLGRNMASTAEKIYFQGPPSRTVLEARMPKGVLNISIIGEWGKQNQEIILQAKSSEGPDTEFPYPVKVNINGTFNASLSEISTGAGIKKINIEAYETPPGPNGEITSFVFINFGGRCPTSTLYDFNHNGILGDLQDKMVFCSCKTNVKFRPSKVWYDRWFTAYISFIPDSACMNTDYNGDCRVDDADMAIFNAKISPQAVGC